MLILDHRGPHHSPALVALGLSHAYPWHYHHHPMHHAHQHPRSSLSPTILLPPQHPWTLTLVHGLLPHDKRRIPLILLSIVSFVNAIISILEVYPLVSPSLGSSMLHHPSTELKGSRSLREHRPFSVRSPLEPFGRCA